MPPAVRKPATAPLTKAGFAPASKVTRVGAGGFESNIDPKIHAIAIGAINDHISDSRSRKASVSSSRAIFHHASCTYTTLLRPATIPATKNAPQYANNTGSEMPASRPVKQCVRPRLAIPVGIHLTTA